MTTVLRQHFPMIPDREEVLSEIHSRRELDMIFTHWTQEQQQLFLDYCTGVRGVKLLYDQFFKEIINPDSTPERLEEILSLLLETRIKILKVLPNDSARIAAETSLLILDIVVQMEDGSIANVEIQRIGYAFPGQRSACYSADLLLRQYKRLKGEKGKKFSYRDIKKVYTIVFFEKSIHQFHQFQNNYIHHMKQQSDTGIQIDLLQEYVFITLDIFRKKLQNKKVIENRLEAWLTFLCEDDPDTILALIKAYPDFEKLYKEVYEMCRNTERMMRLFSKELEELDKNTVQYMIDEMQDTIDAQKDTIDSQKDTIDSQKDTIDSLQDKIAQLEQLLKTKKG